MTTHAAVLTVQKWGNSLAVRIPADIARSAHFHLGTTVELVAHNKHIIVCVADKPPLTLNERLKLFDLKKHGGEVMATGRVGKEQF